MPFKALGLSEPIARAVAEKGYSEPSTIQEKAIPVILQRKDIMASAQTGTGKTAGFVLPVLEILSKGKQLRNRPIRALVLTPTRELAAQVYDNIKEYSTFIDFRSTVIFGGVNQNPQVRALKSGVDMLVATPGRFLDLHDQGCVSFNSLQILILDEADRMLDMGFMRDIKRILALLPARRQNLLFSATFSKDIKKLANNLLHDPVRVVATPENTTAEMVAQRVYRVDKTAKSALIIKLISEGNWSQVLIFTRTKHGANRLAKKLDKKNITSSAIHGNKTQGARTRALAGFKKGDIRVLVATDIAARGLDIPLLPHVVNFELPNISEDYIHRIGRTGRAGASGEALSLVSADELEYLKGIEKLLGKSIDSEIIEGFEPTETIPSKPEPTRGQTRSAGNKSGGSSKRKFWNKRKRR